MYGARVAEMDRVRGNGGEDREMRMGLLPCNHQGACDLPGGVFEFAYPAVRFLITDYGAKPDGLRGRTD